MGNFLTKIQIETAIRYLMIAIHDLEMKASKEPGIKMSRFTEIHAMKQVIRLLEEKMKEAPNE